MHSVVYQGFKLQRSSVGAAGLHNTVIKSDDALAVYTSDFFSRALSAINVSGRARRTASSLWLGQMTGIKRTLAYLSTRIVARRTLFVTLEQ